MRVHPLRVAQIGVGRFGAYRRQTLRESGLFHLVALYDWNEERLDAAAREEDTVACRSYEELLETPDLEAVIISTGAKFHATQLIAALWCGLPVFTEKPLCASSQELQEVLEVQRATTLPVGVGHLHHGTERISRTIKTLMDQGELGSIVAFEKTTAHSGGFHIKPDDWRGDPNKNPGGMLFQCGVHAIHELAYYFGAPVEVSARMRYDIHSTQTADAALCHFAFESGVVGTLNAYHITPYRHTLSIFGTGANLYRDERHFEEGTRPLTQRSSLGRYEPHEIVNCDGEDDPYGNLRAFYHAVRMGEMQYPSLLDGARAVAAIFAADEAARTGCHVKIARFS